MKMIRLTVAALAAAMALLSAQAEKLVILHTNDTHSQIDPNEKGLGGVARRKALIDSVRSVQPNVMLVDAGDAVQGTLYFSLFGGEVESKVMNMLGYDIQILGNHEFDNGMEALAGYLKNLNARKLSSNYRTDGTPLEGLLDPYYIKEVGGKKIGFIAINLIPKGMISDEKSEGLVWLDGLEAADSFAWILKNYYGCDKVVAVTHIGYEKQPGYSDTDIASRSKNIDVIIGGHSHTVIDPTNPGSKSSKVVNAVGDTVLVAQTGKAGQNVGEIIIDLDNGATDYKLIPVNSRLDAVADAQVESLIAPYRERIDSVMNIRIGKSAAEMPNGRGALLNFVSDFVLDAANYYKIGKSDLAIMNVGGLRRPMLKGPITKGEIMQIMPFDNSIEVIELSGADLLEAFDVMAARGGDGVSRNVRAIFNPSTGKCTSVTIDGKPIDPDKTYRLATINYLAGGGDYMVPLTRGKRVGISDNVLYDDMINFLVSGPYKGKTVRPDNTMRMKAE